MFLQRIPITSSRARLYALAGCALLTFPVAVFAAEWSLEPAVSLSGEYNDNYRLSIDDEDKVWGAILTPRVGLNYLTETLEVRGLAQVEIERYDDDELDRENQLYRLNSLYRATERNTLRLRAVFQKDSVLETGRVSEAVSEAVEDPGAELDIGDTADVAVVEEQVERETVQLAPSWTWSATERTRLSLSYRFLDVSYPDADPSFGLVDHNSHQGSAGVGYQLTERDTVTGAVTYTRAKFEREPSDDSYDDWALTAGVSRAFSETLTGSLEGGVRFTSFERDGQEEDDTGYLVSAQLTQRGESGFIELRADHDLVPSGAGALIETDRVAVLVDRRLTHRFSVSFLAEYFQKDSLAERETRADRRFFRLNPALRWYWTPELALDLSYRYVNLKRDIEDESATSNTAFVMLSYRWPRIAVSR